MREVFYEETCVNSNYKSDLKKFRLLTILSIASFVFVGLWFFAAYWNLEVTTGNTILNILFILVPMVAFFVTGLFLFKARSKFCVDYDYTFISGTLKFAKVINNKSRKFLFKFDTDKILRIGKAYSKEFDKILEDSTLKISLLTSNEEPDFGKELYYIYASFDGERQLLILECTKNFVVNVLNFCKRTVIDKELI